MKKVRLFLYWTFKTCSFSHLSSFLHYFFPDIIPINISFLSSPTLASMLPILDSVVWPWSQINSFVSERKLQKQLRWWSSIWMTQLTRFVARFQLTLPSWIQQAKLLLWKVSVLVDWFFECCLTVWKDLFMLSYKVNCVHQMLFWHFFCRTVQTWANYFHHGSFSILKSYMAYRDRMNFKNLVLWGDGIVDQQIASVLMDFLKNCKTSL